MAEWSKALPC